MLGAGPKALLSLGAAVLYFFSNPKPQNYYDYTFRVAGRLLSGAISLSEPPPPWLNEFVPFNGGHYSVFPLGAVISMIPAALLKAIGLIGEMPGALIAAILAGVAAWLMLSIAEGYKVSQGRAILTTAGILFGTWMWTNLTFAGAWQLALGFAVVGELGAIYFTFIDRRPVVAGVFFAMGFGNRTEILLTAPIFFYFLFRPEPAGRDRGDAGDRPLVSAAKFAIVPFVLGVATLTYNFARFGYISDFGYARIPGVLKEPWYRHGIFSTQYIPGQAWEMLLKLWDVVPNFPYLLPDPFSSSILLSSPFLLLILRVGARDGAVKLAAWIAICVMTIVLWMHGNSGGYQFAYRYAMVLLPWVFVILLESAPKRITAFEWFTYIFSFAANIYACWLFHWTEFLKR
ncbi:MAG: hypothetical protein UZ17_ACD001001558 [Acidobacteria bacterium OLB17]|nr:MAG: hypothetical protein UZ17_ACD001001558 [Acidobacteria bacterium OLB17]